MKKLLALLVFSVLMVVQAAAQQPYPSHPIHLIIGWTPGGSTDTAARLLAQQIGKDTGQFVVVENRPGAGSQIAAATVAQAAPDGYTLLVPDTSFAMIPAIHKSVPYDTIKSFVPVAQIGGMPVVLVAAPSLNVSTLDDLRAVSNTRRLTYSSGGPGTVFHLLAELSRASTGIKADHVPFRGGSEAMRAVLADQVQFTYGSVADALQYINTGKLKALAVITADGRVPLLPDVPTMAELGYKNMAMTQWFGILAPAGTSDDIVRQLHARIETAFADPDVQAKMLARGFSLGVSSPEAFGKLLVSDLDRWEKAATFAGLERE